MNEIEKSYYNKLLKKGRLQMDSVAILKLKIIRKPLKFINCLIQTQMKRN